MERKSDYGGSIIIAIVAIVAVLLVLAFAGLCGGAILLLIFAA